MKKILSLITIALLALTCAACNQNSESSKVNSTTEQTTIEDTTEKVSDVEETTVGESSKVDLSSLSEKEFSEMLAKDSSTNDVKFTVENSGDGIYFLRSDNDDCSIRISFSDYGKNITFSFVTDGSEDECYYVLLNALQSKLFDISLDDQIDILTQYMVDEIDYSNNGIKITETVTENIRVIGIRMNWINEKQTKN